MQQLTYRLQEIRHTAVRCEGLVVRLTGGLLELQHRHQHQRDSLTVREVIDSADAVRERMDVTGQLRVDGITTIHRRFRHVQPRRLQALGTIHFRLSTFNSSAH